MRKIRLSLLKAMLMGLIVLSSSCKRNDEVRTVELDNSFAVSLFSDKVELEQLLNMMDTTVAKWINVDQNGDMYAYYADSIADAVTGDDILSEIKDLPFNYETVFEVPEIPASPVPIPIDLPFGELLSVPFAFEGFSITSVIMESGMLSFDLMTDFPVIEEIVLSSENIVLADGSNLVIDLDLKDDTNTVDVDIDLAQCEITPDEGEIRFSVNIKAIISDQGVGGDYKFSLDGSLAHLKVKSINGSIDEMKYDFVGAYDMNFGISNMSGDFSIVKPLVDIRYINTFGFEAKGGIDSLYLTNVDAGQTSLIKNWEVMEMLLHTTGEDKYETIGDISGQIIDKINIMEDYNQIRLSGNIVMSCDDVKGDMIDSDSHIDVVADVMIPMRFTMDELQYLDTIDFNITFEEDDTEGFSVSNVFDELELKFIIENKLPIQVEPQLYMLSDGKVIDSVFTDNASIHACLEDVPVEDVIVVSIVEDKIDNMLASDKLVLDLRFSTNGNVAVMNIHDYIGFKIGLKTKTTELSF